VSTAFLYFGVPHDSPGGGAGNVLFVMVMIVLANTAFEIALVFNNAMLPHITAPEKLGRVSGWAWGMGYAGGLVCLVLSLLFLVGVGPLEPLLPLPQDHAENIRAVGPLVAVWVFVFTVPMMLFTRDVPRSTMRLG